MPEIVERDGEWCLEGYGDADACYPSENEAKAAQAKLSETKALTFTEPPNWLTPEAEERFSKNVAGRIWDGIQARLGWKDADEATGFKVADNHWLATWSNDFKDREGEIFTRKAIDAYIQRVDLGAVPPPELWVWHTPGTRIGQADWVDRHEHFVIASGTFDDTPDGHAAQAYYAKHGHEKGISHGYQYPVAKFDGKHYHQFNSFEFSPLPLGAEANLFTSLDGVKAAKMNEKKQAELEKVFGKDRAAEILANLEARGKALEELEVEYKDFTGTDAQAEARKEALDAANKTFTDLVPDLMEGSGVAVTAALAAVKAAKATDDKLATLTKQVTALAEAIEQRPRSSQSKETEVEVSHLSETLQKALKEQNTVKDSFWGTTVSNPQR